MDKTNYFMILAMLSLCLAFLMFGISNYLMNKITENQNQQISFCTIERIL